jgi:hypothetical protein
MSERGPFDTRATAIHEAGHAVAAATYGPTGWRVTIKEDEHRNGGLDFCKSQWPERDEVADWITRCLVGRWAEWAFRRAHLEDNGIVDGDPQWTGTSNMVRDGAENDYILAKDYAIHCRLAIESDFVDRFESAFWVERDARARQFVKCWRDPIMRVADQLELNVELRDDQVRQIVRRTRPVVFLVKRLRNLIGASRRLLADPRA